MRFFEVAFDHGGDERLPVRKILVERSDGDARSFGDAGGRQSAISRGQQNLNGCLENRGNRRLRSRLNRLFSRLERGGRDGCHECEFPRT
jgi:hypothetical protein